MGVSKNISFIINPISGISQKVKIEMQIKSEINRKYHIECLYTKHENHGTELAKEAINRGADAIVAVGGDGSINELGKALLNSKIPMGIIPAGSGNGFARHLKIPLNIKESIHVINRFKTKRVDAGLINGEPFFATAGIGFDAHVGNKFASFGRRGLLAYMQIATQEFFKYRPIERKLIIDGKEELIKAFLISFANAGQYGNNAWISPKASIRDGKINVCIIDPFPSHLIPDIIFRLFTKAIDKSPYYRTFSAEQISVIGKGNYHMDGEPKVSKGNLEIQVLPRSLKVIY